jgi:hypothetical protein
MARTTDLMVNIYGNDKSAGKTLKGVGKQADNVGDQFKRMGKVAATTFLAVGAAAGAFAAQSIKNAIEDEKSQRRLAIALKNTVNATKEQTASVEDYINKTQARYGVVDDQLRPSLQRLLTATKDITKAQELQTLALDVSAGTGKDLETVSNAIGKAYGGNLASLQRLGLGLDASVIKSKDTKKAFEILSKTFSGQAAGAADSLEGRFGRLKIAVDETKEQIGYALMPVIEIMATYLTDTVVPNVQAFVDGLTGVENKSGDAMTSIYNLGEKTRGFFKFLKDNEGLLKGIGIAIGAIFIGAKAAAAVNAMIAAVGMLVPAFVAVTGAAGTAAAAEAAATGGASLAVAAPAIIGIATALSLAGLAAMWMWNGKKEPSASDKKVKATTGVNLNGNDPAVALAAYRLTQTNRSEGKNGLVWFNGYQLLERPYMHSVKNQPLFGSHTTIPGTNQAGYRAMGGPVARGASYIVGERGPELITMGGNGFVTPNNRLGGMGGTTVVVNVAGSVIHERDLAVAVRDNIAQLMRRRGLNPAILGV